MPTPNPIPASSPQARVLSRAAGMRGGAREAGIIDVHPAGVVVVGANALRGNQAAANDALFNEQPGMIERGLDTANSLGGKYFLYEAVSVFFGGAMGYIGAGFNWLGKKNPDTFLGKVGNFFAGVKNIVQAPINFMRGTEEVVNGEIRVTKEAATLSNWVSKITDAIHDKVEKWFGTESAETMARNAARAETAVNSGVGFVFKKATTGIGAVLEKVDAPFHAKAGYHARRTEKIFDGMKDHLGNAEKVFAEHKGVLGDLHGKMQELQNVMQTQPGSDEVTAGQALLKKIHDGITALQETHVDNKDMKPVLKAAYKAVAKLDKPLEQMSTHLGKVAFWRNVPGAMTRLPGTIGNTSLHQAAVGGAFMAMTLAAAGNTTFHLTHEFHLLRHMIAEVEGIKESNVSTWHVLMGDVPPVLKAARRHFIGKYGWEVVLETLAVGLNIALFRKNSGVIAMTGVIAAPMAGKMLADQNPLITMYGAMEQMQAAGQPLTANMYAEFIHAATENSATLNLGKRSPQARQMLMEEYAGVKASPSVVLKEIESGKMEQRIEALEKQVTAKAQQPVVKEVVGKHSEQVLAARNGAVMQQVTAPNASIAANDASHETPSNKLTQVAHSGPLKANSTHVAGAVT